MFLLYQCHIIKSATSNYGKQKYRNTVVYVNIPLHKLIAGLQSSHSRQDVRFLTMHASILFLCKCNNVNC